MKPAPSSIRECNSSVFPPEVRHDNQPVVLLFLGVQCPASRSLEQVIDELAPTYLRRLSFVKVNAAKAPDLVQRYRIHHVPSLVVVHGESVLYLAMGVLPERELEAIFSAVARRSRDPVDSPSGSAVK